MASLMDLQPGETLASTPLGETTANFPRKFQIGPDGFGYVYLKLAGGPAWSCCQPAQGQLRPVSDGPAQVLYILILDGNVTALHGNVGMTTYDEVRRALGENNLQPVFRSDQLALDAGLHVWDSFTDGAWDGNEMRFETKVILQYWVANRQ